EPQVRQSLESDFPPEVIDGVTYEARGIMGASVNQALPIEEEVISDTARLVREADSIERSRAAGILDDEDATGIHPTVDAEDAVLTENELLLIAEPPYPIVEADHLDEVESEVILTAVRKATQLEKYRRVALDFLSRNAPSVVERKKSGVQLQIELDAPQKNRSGGVLAGQVAVAIMVGLLRR
ncbi:MAG TPA: hypothetical protein VFH39_04270, partial [Candidatus Saccharimonadales bacterium]|nr:hypothetical protein [Candidatus Saccharimonadales bacterium]